MSRSLAFVLRYCVIASAVAMLLICTRVVHAQTAAPQAVYGFNPGQGTPQNSMQTPTGSPYGVNPMPQSSAPQASPAYGYAAQQPNYAPQQMPQQPNYGYGPQPSPAQQQMAQAQQQQQAPYGYNSNFYPAAQQQIGQQQAAPQQAAMRQPAPPQPVMEPAPQETGRFGYAPDRAYAPTNYGTQGASDPQAYYQQPDNGTGHNSDYRLGSGDKIRVTVFGETDLSGDYDVDGSGTVRLPLIGSVRATGNTTQGLQSVIAGMLAPGYMKNPRVNVEIVTYRPFYIVGAVSRPGNFPYVDHMNALNAVALAGGFTDKAKKSVVYVRHEGSVNEEEVPIDAFNRIRPGDVIRVDTTLFWDAMDVFTPLAPAAFAVAAVAP